MQSLSAFFEDNKPLAFVIIFAALLVLIIVLFLLYRVLFGRRLRTSSGGRARQPRLGVVDAYDLDRQRQLVLVRRDNVEHLIMIGGPNDVVLESSIVRAQSLAGVPAGRDKDMALPAGAAAPQIASASGPAVSPGHPPRQAPPIPAAGSGTAPLIPSPFPPNVPATPPLSSASPGARTGERAFGRPVPPEDAVPGAGPGRSAPAPPPGRPGGSAPATRPGSTTPAGGLGGPPRAPSSTSTPRPAPPRTPSSLPPRPSLASNLPPRPTRPMTPPPPLGPTAPREGTVTPGQTSPGGEPEARPMRPPDSTPPVSMNAAPSPRPGEADPAIQPSPKGLETLESLEEEMAKLLGRPASRGDGPSG